MRLCVGTELKAHGFEREGVEMLVSAAAWSRLHLPRDGSIPVAVHCADRLFAPTYYGDMFAETRAFYQNVLAHDSLNLQAHEALGALAARQHDGAVVNQMDAWMVSHPSQETGRIMYSRARIAALAGQTSRAMSLLTEAVHQGLKNRMNIHADPDMSTLKNLPQYRKLLAIRG